MTDTFAKLAQDMRDYGLDGHESNQSVMWEFAERLKSLTGQQLPESCYAQAIAECKNLRNDEIRLHCDAITAPEMRVCKAVAGFFFGWIERRAAELRAAADNQK